MGRKKILLSYPRLNDCKGDLTGKWYVEYSFRLPDDPEKKYTQRVYDGLCSGTSEERRARACVYIEVLTNYLKSGEYLKHDANYIPVRNTDDYRPEAQRWNAAVSELQAAHLLSRFMEAIRPTIRKKTQQDYEGKLRAFRLYCENDLQNAAVTKLEKRDLLPFFERLASERDLCRRSIEKYEQIVRAFFNWLEDAGYRPDDSNPLKRLPHYGKVIDCKPMPFADDDRTKLKNAISEREPYLWLACEMQYYCAIRPGTELRLCKVGDIDRKKHTIIIPAENAKAKRTDTVGIPTAVMAYMERLGIFNYPNDFYIFGRYGIPSKEPLGKNTMRNRFNYYREALGISKKCKFYSWKHTGAISAANNGMPVIEMKDYLRHKDINTTMQYLQKRAPTVGKQAKYIDEI